MTPLGELELLAMLRTFYPQPSAAALSQARAERPEYFSGGELEGADGATLRLSDGRELTLIGAAADGSGLAAWQVPAVPVPGADASYPLTPGPLVPIDPRLVAYVPLETDFAGFVAGRLGEAVGAEIALEGSHAELAAAADPSAIEEAFNTHAGDAEWALEGELAAFDVLNPGEGFRATDGLHGATFDAQSDYPDPDDVAPAPPPEVTPWEKDPPNEGPGSPWYQQ